MSQKQSFIINYYEVSIVDKPKVFANPINKKIINSQEVFYEKKPDVRRDNYDSYNVLKKINDIFHSSHHVYKSKVSILTKDGEIVSDIIGKTENSLLTLDGKSINIAQIIDVKKI